MMQRGRRGFTFIEIMFVVVIIGVLLALVGPRLVRGSTESRITAARAQMKALETAIRTFELDMGRLPARLSALIDNDAGDERWRGPYLDDETPEDPWGRAFAYTAPSDRTIKGFELASAGPDGEHGTADDVVNGKRKERGG